MESRYASGMLHAMEKVLWVVYRAEMLKTGLTFQIFNSIHNSEALLTKRSRI